MGLVVANSMDKYTQGMGAVVGLVGGYWNVLTASNIIGDGFTANPQCNSGAAVVPGGSIGIGVPAWGTRKGNQALYTSSFQLNPTASFGTTYTRSGSECMRYAIPGASQSTRLIHFAYGTDTLPTIDTMQGLIMHFGNSAGSVCFSLAVSPTGRLELLDFSASTVGSANITAKPNILAISQSPVIQANNNYFISVSIVTTNSGGTYTHSVQVYVDGLTNKVIDIAALSPTNTGNIDSLGFLPADMFGPSDVAPGGHRAIRDFFLLDTSGTYANALVGQAFVSKLGMRTPAAGYGWDAQSRQQFTVGILNSHTKNTGLYTPDNANLEIGASDFTVETEIRPHTLSATAGTVNQIIGKWRDDTNNKSWRLVYDGTDSTLRWEISTDGATTVVLKSQPWSPLLDRQYHVAVSRAAGKTYMFVDGKQLGVGTTDANTYFDGNAALAVGAQINGTAYVANTGFDGFMDETRVTIGVGRYTANFAPPTAAFGRTVGTDPDFNSVVLLMGYESVTPTDESSFAHAMTAPDVTCLQPNDAANLYDVVNGVPTLDDTYIEAPNTYATGRLTFNGLPTAAETITIGATTYTWKAAVAAANDVLIGATTADCISNLIAAVNAGAGAGTVYGTGTVANADATAATYQDPQMDLRAIAIGTAGNAVATTTTMANGAFDDATLVGGLDIPADTDFTLERLPIDVTGVVAAMLTGRAKKSDAGSSAIRFDLVGPAGTVGAGSNVTPTLDSAWVSQTFNSDPDTGANLTPSTIIGGKLRVKRIS